MMSSKRSATLSEALLPYDVVKILDEEGKEVPPNRDGELATKGPGSLPGT